MDCLDWMYPSTCSTSFAASVFIFRLNLNHLKWLECAFIQYSFSANRSIKMAHDGGLPEMASPLSTTHRSDTLILLQVAEAQEVDATLRLVKIRKGCSQD